MRTFLILIIMKSTKSFKEVISAQLELVALRDPLFAKTLQKENKSIDECILYILNTVQKSGINGYTDDEIYKMAVHYYDEDSLKGTGNNNVSVVVNHATVLSPDEIAKAKQKAIQEVINDEKTRMKRKAVKGTAADSNPIENRLFDETEE